MDPDDRPGYAADRRVSRRRLIEALGGAAIATLAGCTGRTAGGHDHEHGHDHGGHGGPEKPTSSRTVKMVSADDGFHFEPHVAWVEPGGTVTFEIDSGAHSATAYHPDNDGPLRVPEGTEAWDSGVLSEAGQTFERTFETAGVYDYFCRPHESRGMVGTVLVGRPDHHDQPGLAAPQDSLPSKTRETLNSRNGTVESVLEGGGGGGH